LRSHNNHAQAGQPAHDDEHNSYNFTNLLRMTPVQRSLKMHLSQKEPIMARHIPLTFSTILLGLVGASTYLLCSTDMLHNGTFFLLH
jgi:hypothetical protein